MIFAAGLSPAWQQILQFETLQQGEVNRAETANWCASGKVLNVGIAAKLLGERTCLLSTIGGMSGEAIAAEIEAYGIQAEWIRVEQPTRVCTTILEESGATTELVENTSSVEQSVLDDFLERFQIYASVADVTVLTGSLPENAPVDSYARFIRNVPTKFILDIRGEGLTCCLPFNPYLIKPNREELELTVGEKLPDEAAVINAMHTLNKMGAQWVLVTDGPESVLLTSLEENWRFQPPRAEVVNPIGCGDCLAAGIAVGLSRGQTIVDAVKLGIGAATVNLGDLFPARVDVDSSANFAEQVLAKELPT